MRPGLCVRMQWVWGEVSDTDARNTYGLPGCGCRGVTAGEADLGFSRLIKVVNIYRSLGLRQVL